MSHYFYIARCSDDSLYCGWTNDLKKREEMHNSAKGARYTRSRRPVHIIYSEPYGTRAEAMSREAIVKGWKKTQKEALVTGTKRKRGNERCLP